MVMRMNYAEAVNELGSEIAAALLEEEYNQFIRGIEPAAASECIPFEFIKDDYIDYIETIGHRKVVLNNEKLYRMEEGF